MRWKVVLSHWTRLSLLVYGGVREGSWTFSEWWAKWTRQGMAMLQDKIIIEAVSSVYLILRTRGMWALGYFFNEVYITIT